jgi:hypothetical protein
MNAFRRALRAAIITCAILATAPPLSAQTTQSGTDNPPPEQTYNPIPRRLVWPGIAVIVLIAIFVTAALAGPLIRANHDESESTDSPDQPS